MKTQSPNRVSLGVRSLNAVALQYAVLCAECDVVSDSPHDRCLVCGSASLLNISRLFGGTLPQDRARLKQASEAKTGEHVLVFPRLHRIRRKVSA